MKDTVIRGKAAGFVLFAAMMIFSIWAQQQELAERSAVSPAGNKADTEKVMESDGLPRKIAITFDDGPHPSYTKLLLDGLRERGVHATFFVIGKNIGGREQLIEQMKKDGHVIGNHTFDHVDISRLSVEDACGQLTKTSELIQEITGEDTPYVRPPFGKWDENLDCRLSMIEVGWTVDPKDWTTSNTREVVRRVVSQAEENDIILLHDYYKSSVNAALEIVDILEERGFEFVTVDELLLE